MQTQWEATLGAAALASTTMASPIARRVTHFPDEEVQRLGRFIIALQENNGRFVWGYSPEEGMLRQKESLYYPGEAALGLIALYRLDGAPAWREAALRALLYIANTNVLNGTVRPDHCYLIALAELVPYLPQNTPQRALLIRYGQEICDAFLAEQSSGGGFDVLGRTTPTAVRLEGLLAARTFITEDGSNRLPRLSRGIRVGIRFLLKAQIASGPFMGGMPAVAEFQSRTWADDAESRLIRIDYVQHALSAFIRYDAILSQAR